MDDHEREKRERFRLWVEENAQHVLDREGEERVIGEKGAGTATPSWRERTKHQRLSEKVKTYGYPLGLIQSMLRERDGMVEGRDVLLRSSAADERSRQEAIHESVAWSLDAEVLLARSTRPAELGRFEAEDIDDLATHFLVWLHKRGFQVVPIEE